MEPDDAAAPTAAEAIANDDDGAAAAFAERMNGAGEMLVFSAADFEDFREPRPDMPAEMESELEAVVRILAEKLETYLRRTALPLARCS